MIKYYIIVLVHCCISLYSFSQSGKADKHIIAGNEFYRKKEFAKAESEYSKAVNADPKSATAKFNLANTLYQLNRQVEAAQLFLSLSNNSVNDDLLAKTFYNQGVILSGQKNVEQSIEAYKKALRIDPSDIQARENLQKALLELKKKKQPEKKEDKKKKQPQDQKQKQPSKMDLKEAEQRLKLLEQKEKEVQKRVQKDKAKEGGSQTKDW